MAALIATCWAVGALMASAVAAPPGWGAVVGGSPADAPGVWAVWAGERLVCTATTVSPGRLLTARHCVDEGADRVDGLGPIRDARTHPVLDVATLEVDDAGEAPWPLATPEAFAALAVGDPLALWGYGADDARGEGARGTLRRAEVALVSTTCPAGLGCAPGAAAETELVAGGDGVDACAGDSGGPLVDETSGRLVGVVSRAVLGNRRPCGDGGIYVRADAVAAWVEEDVRPRGCGGSGGMAAMAPWGLVLALRRRRAGNAGKVALVVALSAVACGEVPSAPPLDDAAPDIVVREIGELWEALAAPAGLATGAVVIVDGVVVAGPTADGLTTFLADPVTGDGLAVLRVGRVTGWPPPAGAEVRVRGAVAAGLPAPVLTLAGDNDRAVRTTSAEPVVAEAPDAPRAWTLASWPDVTVTSWPDPLGRADTSLGRPVSAALGAPLPAAGDVGRLTGVVLDDGAVALRDDPDWDGPRGPGVIVDTTLAAVVAGDFEDGTHVRFEATQWTPWSPGAREVVVGDALTAPGLWVDAEGFGRGVGAVGDRGTWRGEVRRDDDGLLRLRTWFDPVVLEAGAVPSRLGPAPAPPWPHGLPIVTTVSGIGPVSATGERTLDSGTVLDDRFGSLAALPDPARVFVVVDQRGGEPRWAVGRADAAPAP